MGPTNSIDLGGLARKLRDFGLLENEAKVYASLLIRGPLRPSETSQTSGVARAEVHRHLRSLEKRGFCLVVAGKIKKYSAIPLDGALSSIVEQERKRRDDMESSKERLIMEWARSQRPDSKVEDGSEKFQVLRDTKVTVERGARMISDAQKLARVSLHKATIQHYVSSGILQSLVTSDVTQNRRAKPQAEIRVLLLSSPQERGDLREMLKGAGFPVYSKVRWIYSAMLEALPDAIIADDKELLIHIVAAKSSEDGTAKEREVKAVLTNVSSMVKPFVMMFDQGWRDAFDFESRGAHRGIAQ